MSTLIRLCFSILVVLLLSDYATSADPYGTSPALAPQTRDDSPFTEAPASPPSMVLPYLSPDVGSHSAPPPLSSDFGAEDDTGEFDEGSKGYSGGLKGGHKAGIAMGVIVGVCIVGLGGILYKKRRDNIRRMHMYDSARIEML